MHACRRRNAAAPQIGAHKVIASGQLGQRDAEARRFAKGLASAATDVVGGAFRWGLVHLQPGVGRDVLAAVADAPQALIREAGA